MVLSSALADLPFFKLFFIILAAAVATVLLALLGTVTARGEAWALAAKAVKHAMATAVMVRFLNFTFILLACIKNFNYCKYTNKFYIMHGQTVKAFYFCFITIHNYYN